MKALLKVLIPLAFLLAVSVDAQNKNVCYWYGEIAGSKIDAYMCTHIVYSFLGIDSQGGINHLHRNESTAEELIKQVTRLRYQNRNLKVLAAVGGYNEPLVPIWSSLAADANSRTNFANNIYNFIVKNKLNGIDIDWEYPNFNQDAIQDVDNFILLLNALKSKLGSTYSLSVAIGAGPWRTGISYNIPSIFAVCDFVHLMSYDLHGSWETQTGIHAGLFSSSLDPTSANVDASVQLLVNKGVDKKKIIVGIPAYGNAFTLQDPNVNGVGAPASGAGSLKYFEICQLTRSGSLNYRWDDSQKVPYAFSGTQWVGYDDVRSVIEKANYIKNNNLGGSMFWAVDNDDYDNLCGGGKFALIKAVANIVVGGGKVNVSQTAA